MRKIQGVVMKMVSTLNLYLARLYAANFLRITVILLGIVYLFDTVELIRRATKRDGVALSLVFEMGLYKLPETGQILLPFAILFSAIFTFWALSRRHELVVVRAAGFSVWQFLAPVMGVAAFIGVLQMAVVNPIGAVMLVKFETLESQHLMVGERGLVTLFDKGLWLRQMLPDNQGYVILHAEKIIVPSWELREVTALFFTPDDGVVKRIDAKSAFLKSGEWAFYQALVHEPQRSVQNYPELSLPTNLTSDDIEESFSSPMAHSFWKLPSYIKTLTETGFDTTKLRIHLQSLMAQPVLFMAMILLAAAVSLRPPRFQRTFALIASGVLLGFLTFFISSFLQALGASQQIPVFLAAWSPALVVLLLGIAVMLSLEDG
jgi:lipopolysaccharide export system permease protein